ncbi:MAG: S8 family serine peptidase, partial [Clostridiales bacterium]|nr:S8 family serine peptidase [Clostridiales bacterium]
MSVSLKSLNIIKVERTFPYAGKFEARTRAEGLHLWYDIYFDSSVPLTKADEKLSSMDGITYVEYRPKTVPLFTEDYQELLPSEQFSTEQTATSLPFNDPQLSDQWHYYNDGSYSGSVAGCDVNIVPVWEKYTTGSPDVIVSIVDGGIDYHHEDLAGNMWNNPEQSGSYVYGYNFINGGYAITAGNHGTHVAGTISAVNNNGTGVCGIAGGNSKKSIPGVKLMSCQIFDNTDRTGDGSRAIKWGADHGAVISQNSWGYDGGTYTPASDKAAIDYFNKYAGMDENGNQTGPMEGGIVIFAAGNDGKSVGYPGEYEGCLAVAAVGSNYVKARFSNYGSWVDIAAPGVGILSTVPNNSYGKMNGTSMACPHVSGVAALLVSYFKGIGFTRESLWNKLTLSATDIQKYNSGNSEIGGLVNAYTAIASSSTTAPDPVTYLNAAVKSNIVTVSMVVPKDKDDKKAYGISVFFSTSAISSANCDCKNFSVGDLNVGDTLTGIITGLDFESMYYLS